jgi:hypothetical protein
MSCQRSGVAGTTVIGLWSEAFAVIYINSLPGKPGFRQPALAFFNE